jgi:hypothetical protein
MNMDLKTIIISLIASAVVVTAHEYYIKSTPTYATVDAIRIVNTIRDNYDQRMRDAKDAEEMTELYNESVNKIDAVLLSIREYGNANNLIIVDKAAMLSGEAMDITAEVENAIYGH